MNGCVGRGAPPSGPKEHQPKEMGGTLGNLLLIAWSHWILYYLWYCLVHNDAKLRDPLFDGRELWSDMRAAISEHARPTAFAVAFYSTFFVGQLLLAAFMPGPELRGRPVEYDETKRLSYLINGLSSWWLTLGVMLVTQAAGIFNWARLHDHYGEVLTVAVVFSDVFAVLLYFGALATGNSYRMTGDHVHDFFFGAVLHPRVGRVDLKMFAEGRVSWILLFMLTFGSSVKQAQLEALDQAASSPAGPGDSLQALGFHVLRDGNMWFILLAHFLYSNAVMKGEECIPMTWDIFYEKFGFMLIFWNFTGVPFMYCLQSMYLVRYRNKEETTHPLAYKLMCYGLLLSAYYVWDVSQSQKNLFRAKEENGGVYIKRKHAFPQLPWSDLEKPKYMSTECGSKLLVDGFWKYARKIHYTSDFIMALTWGLICGFGSFVPYFYPFFFLCMILHRTWRDTSRCKHKYGKDWVKYCERVPYVFVPRVF
ncbi:sterol reductase [Chloropicon primus]|uniref:Delta(24(24(1)))-sterol reductase n=2 Tax=Chloropicon primus TaxID=1764295 RepID=A0A5B8MSM3_9CHLO|nr:sterol reductase [Chloropicon primus]UPR01617.1 sterol reductase [Chloropicon primus]|mmetsp:Transcript_3232/g.8984  ORF Transcript_3232/g.8984 Transcript_3232/m.8984 type:complete len:479 (+) Transcript_3232:221-1657(+)|eukprot:QDZ22400.1 sterol reductase [Chloropicon primus]